ncbi:hypothetical protein [uncultured Massilia sp.]|uniref:hypothetical protein n=1 Tax=uncultured Massilia sp. TaxID=169973 RepID=UPI0025CDA0DB|nr:hypothetical protein [uncultured Massilia sp.]
MKPIAPLFASALLSAVSSTACAQDALNDIVRSSTNTKTTFAVFDVRPAGTSLEGIQEAVAAAFRKHYDGIKVMQQMAPYPLPAYAPRMGFHQESLRGSIVSAPDCPQAAAIVTSSDGTLARYGEASVLQGCVFPYRDGYRVNVYALFVQKSGGADVNVLGAMFGRAITNAVGIGDSSRFIGETVDDVETRLKALAPDVALVELQPARAGRTLAADRAAPAPAAPPIAAPMAAAPAAGASLPPELAAVQARLAAMVGQQRPQPAPVDGQASPALQARKDLSAMGLTYYSQDQFVEAARRGDRLACELFLRAGSVTVTGADKQGVTALKVAATPELADFLRGQVH